MTRPNRKPNARRRSLAASAASALALVALVVLVAAPASAAAASKYEIANFEVEVKGIQKSTESFHHKAESECDVGDTSTITEKIVFKSKPKEITAYGVPGQLNPDLLFRQAGKWPTAATISRHYTPRIVVPPPSPQCGENDGGESTGPKDDCGTKKVSDWSLELEFDDRKKDGLGLTGLERKDPFEACLAVLGELSFPYLIVSDTKEEPILADLPQDELFDPKIGKLIVLGNGTKRVEEPDVSVKSSIEWDVSLTRIGGVKTS